MNKKRFFRIVGLMGTVAYLTVIIATWAYDNYLGYTYFQAGEPNLWIKYPEWVLGAVAIITAVSYLKEELDTP